MNDFLQREVQMYDNTTNQQVPDDHVGITFLSMTGDITITWSPENDAAMKDLIRKKMAENYVFFTTRRLPMTNISYKRKLGKKGVDTIENLIIKDKDFEKIVKLMDDADIARNVDAGSAGLAKRKDEVKREFQAERRIRDADEVKKGDRLIATRALAGG